MTNPTELENHFKKEDEEKRQHYAGECDSYCWWCQEDRERGDESLGG